jgi:predicted naringenin-chalcone synthase
MNALGLGPSTQRLCIGFMGCCAAFNALRAADAICRADRLAVVLIVCVELCTLHFQPIETLEDAVISSIFADGAAAAVLSASPQNPDEPALAIAGSLSLLDDDSLDDMTWTIGDTGFLMGLSARVPSRISTLLPDYADKLLATSGTARAEVDAWAVHPGGRKVLDKAAETLDLGINALDESYAVLREYGNMSSPTILFILARIIDRHRQAPMRSVVAMGFGPGLTIEGCVLSSVAGFPTS